MMPNKNHATDLSSPPEADDQHALLRIEHDLKESKGLVLIRDIRFHRGSGLLTFRRASPDHPRQSLVMKLHPDDQDQFIRLAGQSQVSASLRLVSDSFASFVLILQECESDTAWPSGMITHVERPRELLETIATKSRLEDLGEKASVLGHELRQPLYTIAMANENLRLMLGAPDQLPPKLTQAIDRIEMQVQRAQTIIALTLGYATGTSESCDMVEAVRNAADFLGPLLESADVRFDLHAQAVGLVALGSVQQEQIFVNVIRNAVDSIQARRSAGWSGEGVIVATIEGDPASVRCLISDNGAGVAPGAPEKRFRPFFTTKSDEGTGLGLYVCEQIVAIAGGSIRLLPGETEGALVEILLPRFDGPDE